MHLARFNESVATRLAAAVPEKRVLELIVDHQDHGAATSAGEVSSVWATSVAASALE